MFKLLAVACIFGLVRGDTLVINEAVDQLLEGIREQVRAKNMDSIPVEEMSHTWSYRWKIVHLTGHVDCWDGWVRSLLSIHRTGDVSVATDGNKLTLNIALGLGDLELGFEHCRFKAEHLFQVTQKISAKVDSNSVEAQITVIKNGEQCTVVLDRLALTNIGKISVNTGGGVIHNIEDHLLDWIAKHIHDKVVNNLSEHLQDLARLNLARADLCHKIPF